ncbi:MAG: hypothetical protein JNK32_08390 [Anaerolineales bacterium]|nr:hypothetical protein [Anaerolineales bacterium]
MKRIISIFSAAVIVFLFIGCGEVPSEVPPDNLNSVDATENVGTSEPLTEIYMDGYVTVFLPVQDSGEPIYSHQIDFTFDAENVPVDGDYKLIRPVIHLYISHEKEGGEEIFDFSPSIEITILYDKNDVELAQLQDGVSPADSFAIAIYDKFTEMWIPQETLIVDNGDGTGSGMVKIASWTSGAAWVCRGNACRR